MSITLNIDRESCIKCGKCVAVCPSQIFSQPKKGSAVEINFIESCILCGQCVAVCPTESVIHSTFPSSKVHKTDYSQLPTAEQLMLLLKNRRSNRAFSNKAIPQESIDMILEAAHRAPTGSNAQHVRFILVTNPDKLRLISQFTMDVFASTVKKLKNPLLKPLIKLSMPDAFKYLPVFERLQREYAHGNDGILRGAAAVLFICTPKGSRMGAADANLAYQNGSLMAESLGVSQFYTGFVINAANMKKQKLEKILGIDGQINAGMALGMPLFRFKNYIDRKEIEVTEI
ncbi:MAG: nitroreductase family protein [Bacteroidales bacterium]|nr:nitroreductase family protein [Bacteroidales bacterium]